MYRYGACSPGENLYRYIRFIEVMNGFQLKQVLAGRRRCWRRSSLFGRLKRFSHIIMRRGKFTMR